VGVLSTSGTSLSARPTAPSNVRWHIFGLSCATSWTLYLHRYTFGLAMPTLAEEWHVDLTELGFMQSAFYGTYVALQVPCGMLVDWLGTHLFLGGIVLAWSAVLALHAWVPGPAEMYWVRVLFGATQAGCYPALGKVTQAWFPFSIRTSLQGWIASFSGRLGGASANLLFATLLLGWLGVDWRTSLLILAGWGVLLGVTVLVVFRNTPAEHPRVNAAEREIIAEQSSAFPAPPDGLSLAHPASISSAALAPEADPSADLLWSRRIDGRSAANLGFFLLQFFGATFADTIYVVWMPSVLKSVHGVSDADMGFYSSLPLFGGALGGLTGGYINDLMIRAIGRRWARSIVGFGGNVAAGGLVVVALLFFDNPRDFCGILFCAKVFSDWCQPTTWGTITDISGPFAATVFGLGNGVGGLGTVIAAPLLGLVAKRFSSWHPVFLLIAATYGASSVCWLAVNCTIPVFRPAARRNCENR
jgi:ACS family D-galactonate transporter-like MFS transporter